MAKGNEKKPVVQAKNKFVISFERVLTSGSRIEFSYKKKAPDFRANVGARNPFVIARRLAKENKLGKELELLIKVKDPKELKEVVDTIFEKSIIGMADIDLFDPKSGSPIYSGLYTSTKNLFKITQFKLSKSDKSKLKMTSELKKNIDFYSGFYEHCLQSLKKESPKVGAEPSFCQTAQIDSAQSTTFKPADLPLKYRPVPPVPPPPPTKNDGLEFNDPVQGCVADCWLISALSSIAWAEQTAGFTKKLSRVLDQPKFWAFDAQGQWKSYFIPVNPRYYRDTYTTEKDPYYARTNNFMMKYPFYECWGPCYEKACAWYWQKGKIPPFTPPSVDDPDYKIINYNSPFQALMDLTGLSYVNTTFYTDAHLPGVSNPPHDGEDILEQLRTDLCGGGQFSTDPAIQEQFLGAIRPASAYTYYSAGYVPAGANPPTFNDTVTYCYGISANHAFSVLGIYQEKNGGVTTKYVVLRNPWGSAGESIWFTTIPPEALAGRLKAAVDASPIAVKLIYNSPTLAEEGIFALRADYFMRYFEAYGWV